MAFSSRKPKSREYTQTTSDIKIDRHGVYRLDFVADSYGEASIEEMNDAGSYVANGSLSFTSEAHEVVQFIPHSIIKVVVSGATNPVVTLTPLK